MTGSYYEITIRLVYDNYMIPISCLCNTLPLRYHLGWMRSKFLQYSTSATRITSTASATTSYPYISMCANCDFCENIAWVFGVNWAFGAFLIYPIYPKNPKYYFFVFSSLFKQQICITNSFSFDYADSPYHRITSSPPSYGLSADTFSAHLKKSAGIASNIPSP